LVEKQEKRAADVYILQHKQAWFHSGSFCNHSIIMQLTKQFAVSWKIQY
jgi:hypothetical protein